MDFEQSDFDFDTLPDPNLDREQIKRLASIMCTEEQIAAFCNVSVNVIRRHYSVEVQTGHDTGKIQLRQWQMEQAQKGNIDMLKWLGKQFLGQTDHR